MHKPLCLLLVAAGLTFIFPVSSWAGKRALVIGVNTYSYHDKLMEETRTPLNLEGCAEDARDVRRID